MDEKSELAPYLFKIGSWDFNLSTVTLDVTINKHERGNIVSLMGIFKRKEGMLQK